MRRSSRLFDKLHDFLLDLTPKTRFFDKQLSTLQFLNAHRRLP